MKKCRRSVFFGILPLLLFLNACAYEQNYIRGAEIQSRARLVAVLPLVNLTAYPRAGRIVGDLLTTELYAMTDFQIMERTELLDRLRSDTEELDQVVDRTVARRIGRELDADAVIFGSVTEYRYKRGLDESPVVGINIRMLDVASGRILWAGSRSETGGCFWICEDSLSRLAQNVSHELVRRMVAAD